MPGPKLVPESFPNGFLFTGATQQPSAGGKVTGPRPTLPLAMGRVCMLDMGHGKKKPPETQWQRGTRLIYPTIPSKVVLFRLLQVMTHRNGWHGIWTTLGHNLTAGDPHGSSSTQASHVPQLMLGEGHLRIKELEIL